MGGIESVTYAPINQEFFNEISPSSPLVGSAASDAKGAKQQFAAAWTDDRFAAYCGLPGSRAVSPDIAPLRSV